MPVKAQHVFSARVENDLQQKRSDIALAVRTVTSDNEVLTNRNNVHTALGKESRSVQATSEQFKEKEEKVSSDKQMKTVKTDRDESAQNLSTQQANNFVHEMDDLNGK